MVTFYNINLQNYVKFTFDKCTELDLKKTS